jgi:phosphoribosylformylglycinamidine (FGAM) synthase-like amidotransferase family enzyme
VNIYRTSWKDRWQRKSVNFDPSAGASTTTDHVQMSGIQEVHQGVELDFVIKPVKILEITGMFSYGDYYYKGNAMDHYLMIITTGIIQQLNIQFI